MAIADIQLKPMPLGAPDEFKKIREWLQSNAADFQTANNIKICKNTDALSDVTKGLLKKFVKGVTVVSSKTLVTAIHFEQSAIVPVDEGWVVDLMPVHTTGPVKVEGKDFNLGHYVHLTEDANVSGDFFAILLLSKLKA
ncbi:hypothetical protein F5B19DRAFT_498789 [Rostrohypoxylon terebratum]|nr:hypothetical protein F5B19DRAFT_498789 [Rostrohypoxylon terebratum]